MAKVIRHWIADRGLRRLRSDRRVGPPEEEELDEWAGIFLGQDIEDPETVEKGLSQALTAANRSGQWRRWKFLTLQIQIAAEQLRASARHPRPAGAAFVGEEAASDWTVIKAKIRDRIPEIAFQNWFESTRQVERCGGALTVAVPDEAAATYIANEYHDVVHSAALDEGLAQIRLVTLAHANVGLIGKPPGDPRPFEKGPLRRLGAAG